MPLPKNAEPIYREYDHELLGFVDKIGGIWTAFTIFGYEFASAETKTDAIRRVMDDGLTILKGIWRYYDRDDNEWHPCRLKSMQPGRVTVIRTNELGYQEPETVKRYTITDPDDSNLVALL